MQELSDAAVVSADTPDSGPQQAAEPMLCIGCGLHWLDWSGTRHQAKAVWSKTHQKQLTPGLCEACEPVATAGTLRLRCPHGRGRHGACGKWIGGRYGAKMGGRQPFCPSCRRPIYWVGGFPPAGWSTARPRQKTPEQINAFNPAAVDQLLNESESLFAAFALVTEQATESQDFNRNDALELLFLSEIEPDAEVILRYREINEMLV